MEIEESVLKSYIPPYDRFDWLRVMQQIERVEPNQWQAGDRAHLAIWCMKRLGMIEQIGEGLYQLNGAQPG